MIANSLETSQFLIIKVTSIKISVPTTGGLRSLKIYFYLAVPTIIRFSIIPVLIIYGTEIVPLKFASTTMLSEPDPVGGPRRVFVLRALLFRVKYDI